MISPIRNILKTQISTLRGFEFQEFIDRLFLLHYGTEGYLPTRKTRDQGCDGIINMKTVIACYGCDKAAKNAVLKKVRNDYRKYRAQWSNDFPAWLFVINKEVPSYLITEIRKLQPNSSPIGIDHLVEIIETDLSISSKEDIYDYLKIPKGQYKYIPHEFWALIETVKHEANSDTRNVNAIKRKFHSIVPLTWDYIALEADTRRDVYSQVLQALAVKNASKVSFVAITGQPLSGKSTLMRRVGYDLASKSRDIIYIYKGNNHPVIWDNLSIYYEIVSRVVLILVDDIFENNRAFQSMIRFLSENVEREYNITILGTAVSNDRLERRLNDIERTGVSVHSIKLEFTENDKRQILKNLDIDELSIDSRTHEILMSINVFYSFLLHASLLCIDASGRASGIYSESVEEWRLKDLSEHQPRVYEAYKYVCFANRHKLSLPATLLQRVEGNTFSDILELRGRSDWIYDVFDTHSHVVSLESAHWYLASIYWDVYVQYFSPHTLINEILTSASPDNYLDSLFIMHLFRALIDDDSTSNLVSILSKYAVKIRQLQSTLGVDSMSIWSRIYSLLKMQEQEAECLYQAKRREPVNVADLRVLIPLIEDSDPEKALMLFHKWLEIEPNNGTLRVAYLEFISHTADLFPDEVATLMSQNKEWLKNAGDLWNSTQAYIKFIINHSPDNAPLRLDEISSDLYQWIRRNYNHPNVSSIMISYINIIKLYNCEAIMVLTMDDCWNWLRAHLDERGFILLMPVFISELNKLGNTKRNKEVLDFLLNWTIHHPRVDHIRAVVLQFASGEWATKTEQEMVLKQLTHQIKHIHHGITICNIISLIRNIRDNKSITHTIDDLYEWLQVSAHKKEQTVRASYLKLASDAGTEKQIKDAIISTRNWLLSNESQIVFSAYITLVDRRCDSKVKHVLIDELIYRFENIKYVHEVTLRCTYMTMVRKWGTIEQVKACINQTLNWWDKCFDQVVIANLLTLLDERNGLNLQQLQIALCRAKQHMSRFPNKFQTLRDKIGSLERKYLDI